MPNHKERGKFRQVRSRPGGERGFVHILLLVFAILGISMWGISEILQRSEENQQEAEEAKITGLKEARKALLNYALVAPPHAQVVRGFGRYNAAIFNNNSGGSVGGSSDVTVPFRYFTLPCPDLAADGLLDGVADFYQEPGGIIQQQLERCDGPLNQPLIAGSRVGRLPWRNFFETQTPVPGANVQIRGIGNREILDGYGNPLWYAVSRNLTRLDRAVNPHWLLRQADGWLNLNNPQTGEVVERVAAVVVSPGIYGDSNTGSRLPAGAAVASAAVPALHRAYLEQPFVGGLPTITVVAPTSSASEQLDYISAEQLVAIDGEGIEAVSEGEESIYRIPEGRVRGTGESYRFFGVKDLLQTHFERYGYLPSPAVFSRQAAEATQRPSGPPLADASGINITVSAQIANISRAAAATTLTVLMPGRNVRRVYLQKGTRLRVLEEESRNTRPPFNLALYQMDTALNNAPLSVAVRADLINRGLYPQDNLFGFEHPSAGVFPTAATSNSRTYLVTASLSPGAVNLITPQQLYSGIDISVALAEPAFAYLIGDDLSAVVELAAAANTVVAQSPPHGMQVQLPPGTRFSVPGDEQIGLRLPKQIDGDEGTLDPATRSLVLDRQLSVPVDLYAPQQIFTVVAVFDRLPVKSGNVGFLPIDGQPVTVFPFDTVSFKYGSATTPATATLPGSDRSLLVPGGVRLPRLPVSNLSVPLRLRIPPSTDITIVQFPPGGRPFVGSDTFVYRAAAQVGLPSPLFAHEGTVGGEFTLPAGTRIYYPTDNIYSIDTSSNVFAFQPGTVMRLPRGAVVTVFAEPDTTLPSGARRALGQISGNTVGAGRRQIVVTLFHGAMASIDGAVISYEEGYGTAQELFDIETEAPYDIFDTSGAVVHSSPGGDVLQPLSGRALTRAIAPFSIADGTMESLTWTRAKFLTRPRALVLPDVSITSGIVGATLSITPVTVVLGTPPVTMTLSATMTLGGMTVSGVDVAPLEGLSEFVVPVVARVAASSGVNIVNLTLVISEQTSFLLPPGTMPNRFQKVTVTSALEERNVVPAFIFPTGTGIYDPKIESLADINLNGIDGMAVLESPLTVALAEAIPDRGLIINQLVMLPDADFAVDGTLVPADSVVDVVQAVVWPPGSVRTLPGIAEDLRVISAREIYMYFPQAVMLTNRGEFHWSFPDNIPSPTVGVITVSQVATVTVSYSQYPNVTLAAASGRSTEHEGILANDSIALPAGTFVIVAPGSTLDFLSYNRHTVGADADSVDYATLPKNATAVLPVGSMVTIASVTVNVAGTVTTAMQVPVTIVGPAHIRLGGSGGNGLALVNHASLMATSPVIYYEGDTYAFDGEQIAGMIPSSVQPNFSLRIPAGTRGDIFGHLTRRDGFDFAVNMLPSDTREFLRNFPMIYAVAPRCRAEIADGEDCASDDNGGGLEFALEEGEAIELEEDLIAGGNMRIMPFSPSADGLQLAVEVWELLDYANNQNEARVRVGGANSITLTIIPPQMFMAASLAIDEKSGRVALYPPPGGGAVQTFDNSQVMAIATAANSPNNSVVRVYMNLDDAAADLTAGNHVDLAGVTIHAGGYTQGGHATAVGRVTLNVPPAIARSATLSVGFLSGYGANLVGSPNGRPIFGVDSEFDLALGGKRAQLRLDDYVPVGLGGYRATLYPASSYADVNARGNVNYQANVGEQLVTSGEDEFLLSATNAVNVAQGRLLTVDMVRTSIAMEPGYLWQGYLNSRLSDRLLSVTLQVAAQPSLVTASLAPEVYVRVQPAAQGLNFWGTGRERPEGMDNRSISRQDESSPDNYIRTGANVVINNFRRRGHTGDHHAAGTRTIITGRPFGWRSDTPSALMVRARVYDTSGRVITSQILLPWTSPATRCEGAAPDGGTIVYPANCGGVNQTAPAITNINQLTWGYNSSPFPVSDQSFIDNNEDVWALRRIIGNDGQPLNDDALVSLTIGGVSGSAPFNPPAFQMVATRVAQPRGWTYQSKGANLPLLNEGFYLDATPRVPIPRCDGAIPAASPTPERTPGALLGHPGDVERYASGSGGVCLGNDSRIFSFSSRVRRDSAPATYGYANPLRDRQFLPRAVADTPPLGSVGALRGTVQFAATFPQVTFDTTVAVELRAPERTPAIDNPVSYTIPGNHKAGTLAISVTVQTPETTHTLTAPVNVPLVGDLVFYMERAYNTETPGMTLAIPQQYLQFGDDFSISGPAALVPHFGGHSTLAVADVYGERSRLMSGLFGGEFELHDKYSAATYDCGADETLSSTPVVNCPQMMNPDNARFWVPIVSGVVAYEAAEVKVIGATADRQDMEAVVVLPQPQAEIIEAGSGDRITIYGGSIIHPYSGLVQPSVPISVRSRLVMAGDAVAAVDVSPVNLPTPIRFLRDRPVLQAWDFNYTPVKMTLSNGNVVIVEPLDFSDTDIVDFNSTIRGESGPPINAAGDESQYSVTGGGITATIRYDGTRTRGFLMNDKMADIMEAYYTGEPVFVPTHGFTTYFPRRDPANLSAAPTRLQPNLLPSGNQVAHVGNPLSWHWLHRRAQGSFIPLGAARQFYINRATLYNAVPASDSASTSSPSLSDQNECGSASLLSATPLPSLPNSGVFETSPDDVRPVRYPDFPIAGFPALLSAGAAVPGNQYNAVPCAGSRAYYWTGVRAGSSSSSHAADDDEFTALRLLHLIEFPQSDIILEPNSFAPGTSQPAYPSSKDKFFRFPQNSIANVLQADAASWESVHPYVSRYLPGAVIANDGGLDVNSGGDSAEHMLVPENNDGHRRIDISGRRVLHYARTESAPGDYAHSNAPVYTNVWIRLLRGGRLEPIDANGQALAGGEVISLPAGTIVNPILGVYLPGDPVSAPVQKLESNYAALGELGAQIAVVRPALTIPRGATLRVGSGGGRITNVKAAAIFSLTPLDGIGCPYGGIDGDGVALNEGLQSTVTISQSREGIDESAYDTALGTAAGTTTFTLGHPCAWADDPENTDGDRFFIYRSRRRYEQQHKVRVISDDRTYLLGGKLILGRA